MKTLATSKNLTVVGIATILGALAAAAAAVFDGDPTTNLDFAALGTALVTGFGFILAKGAAVTGGSVPATDEAKERVG
jgi:ABC-type phosphate transport system substrate-binding protein